MEHLNTLVRKRVMVRVSVMDRVRLIDKKVLDISLKVFPILIYRPSEISLSINHCSVF